MTTNKVNQQNETSSRELFGATSFSPLPPPTVPVRCIDWRDGMPVCPADMEEWEFLGFKSAEEFDEALEREWAEMVEQSEKGGEAARNNPSPNPRETFSETSEEYEPNTQHQGLRKGRKVAYCNHSELRKRHIMMQYIKDVLRPILKPTSPILRCSSTAVGTCVEIAHAQSQGLNFSKITGVAHDHNVWVCPLCSLKIAAGRVDQINRLMQNAKAEGFECYHLTLTMPHERFEELEDLFAGLAYSRERFWRNGTIRRIFKDNFVGRVSGVEIMRGFGAFSNGWHPHQHILLIGKQNIDIEAVRKTMSDAWLNCLASVDRIGDEEHALTLKKYEKKEGDYFTKLACEIALGNVTKHGKGEHMSFFQMVNYALTFPPLRGEIEPLIRKFYVGTKGRNQVSFSRGLLARFGVDEKTDEELAEETGDTFRVLAVLLNGGFMHLANESHENVAKMREYADYNDREGLRAWLESKDVRCWDSVLDLQNWLNDREWGDRLENCQDSEERQPNGNYVEAESESGRHYPRFRKMRRSSTAGC